MNKGKVLVTGSQGFLGRHLSGMLVSAGFDVSGTGHGDLDITDTEAVGTILKESKPDMVINCAAISSTSYAARHPDEAYAANVTGCTVLAGECRRTGTALYLMSSDQVYAGCTTEGPLKEDLPLNPGNVYGSQKYLMEQEVAQINPDAVLLRLTWMCERYNPASPHADFVSNILKAVQNGGTIKASTREYRGITDVEEVCRNIIRSFGLLPGGVYNFGAESMSDTYSTMLRIAESAGFDTGIIVPDDSWGRNLAMDCGRINSYGIFFSNTEALAGIIQ